MEHGWKWNLEILNNICQIIILEHFWNWNYKKNIQMKTTVSFFPSSLNKNMFNKWVKAENINMSLRLYHHPLTLCGQRTSCCLIFILFPREKKTDLSEVLRPLLLYVFVVSSTWQWPLPRANKLAVSMMIRVDINFSITSSR